MLKTKKLSGTLALVMSVFMLAACGPKPTEDPTLKITQIAATVQSELTQNAALTPSATPTIEPTATATIEPPTPTLQLTTPAITPTLQPTAAVCPITDNSKFIADVNYPDGEVIKPGTTFTKTWKFQNTGSTTWTTDYAIIYLEGSLLGTNSTTFFKLTKSVKPGESVEVNASFTAPASPGRYGSYWKLYSASGCPFGEYASIDIVSGTATAVPTTAASATATTEAPTSTPTASVTP